jgi:hypothetical protein
VSCGEFQAAVHSPATEARAARRRTLQRTPAYPSTLKEHAGYSEASIRSCVQAMAALQRKAPNASLVAVYKKYCSTKFHEVRF